MSSKDKDNKSLQDKLKYYFKSRGNAGHFPPLVMFSITADVEHDISSASPLYKRFKTLKDLETKVLNMRLEFPGVERIWKNIRDLVGREQPRETRHFALNFLRNLVQGQYEELNIMRTIFFHFIVQHDLTEDTEPRFKLLQMLTDNGKNIKGFEEEIGRFLLDWMQKLEPPPQQTELLELMENVVKYNAAYLDDDVVCDIVNNCCHLCCYSGAAEVVLMCLKVLQTVVCYAVLPHATLRTFVSALCRTVNSANYCHLSWKIMRNILGTDLGHATLYETVEVVLTGLAEAGLVRGAVFYINMALWSSKRVTSLKATHTSVLPAFLKALEGQHSVVTYEVLLALQNLISSGTDVHYPAWEMIFQILKTIIVQVEAVQSPNKLVETQLHELITSIETLHEHRHFYGSVNSLYALIDTCGYARPESSAMNYVTWRAMQCTPVHPGWLANLAALLERYCRREKRSAVRAHTLRVGHELILTHSRYTYEEELLERVVLPHVSQCVADADTEVRLLTAQLLMALALRCRSKCCSELLVAAHKVLNRPFDLYVTNESISLPADPKIIADIKCVVDGLVTVFHHKLHVVPSSHAVQTYLILLDHLEKHYSRPSLFQHHPYVRIKILELFLSARANKYCQIGFCYDALNNAVLGSAALRAKPVFSPYVCVEGGTPLQADSSLKSGSHSPGTTGSNSNISYVSIRKACKLVVQCLTQERDWSVLQLVLREIPNVLQNKPLVLSKDTRDIDTLACALCSMVAGSNMAESLQGVKLTNSDYNGHVLPVLASLAPYHLHLESQTQQKIVKCLIKYGLEDCRHVSVLRTPQQCIGALTIFTLETRDTMVKLLPEVLLKLSQISDTSQIAVPILEFLSTLTRLPKMFASFVADQYMSVFAILLPYTNPFRYNHYVVSLAHHVIAAWFLKCRLSYRRDFVKFIIHGLHNFILLPFEEAKFNRTINSTLNVNEDSSNRMRSSSLGSKGREPLSRNALSGGELGMRLAASASAAFHHELTETCVDLMARYTFSPCSVRPRRGPAAEFMFAGGQSCTWVVGHEVITITTSGCQQNSLRNGLCDRCLALCKAHTESDPGPGLLWGNGDGAEVRDQAAEIKRYTKHTLQHSRSVETCSSSLSMSDNSLLPPSSGQTTRQNSSENRSGSSDAPQPSSSPKAAATSDYSHTQLSLKLEKLAKQEERAPGGIGTVCSRINTVCVCWCSGWAEVHVRRPTGDVSWVMRMQNQMNFDSTLDSPLNDVIGLLAPSVQTGSTLNMSSCRSSGLGDSRTDILSDTDPRSRSGSSSSQHKSTQYSPTSPVDLHKSNSDSVVATGGATGEKKPPHAATHCIVPAANQPAASRGHVSTEPIDIPGSPQRQSSSSTTTDDDDTATYPQNGKSRHPVRRSNSSPEMSSSWKLTAQRDPSPPAPQPPPPPEPLRVATDMILLPSVEPTVPPSHHHQKKPGKNKDMRVSCEAIPEEMSSGGTPPSLPPQLVTYNSDPGEQIPSATAAPPSAMLSVASDTALYAVTTKSESSKHTTQHKSESVRVSGELKVVAKPPQSPAPASPGRAPRGAAQLLVAGAPAAAGKGTSVTLKLQETDRDDLPPLSRSKRSNTISVMSPTRKRRENASPKSREGGRPSGGGGGLTPAFVLLQLYHNMSVRAQSAQQPGTSGGVAAGDWAERPLLVSGVQHERSVKNLDRIPPLETYGVGVLYVGHGQTEETQILQNEFGSVRYGEFLRDLGTLIAVEDAEKHGLYLNMERGGRDGHFAYVWQDDIMQVHFHVATLMPNTASDPTANEKRKHIGNDYVSIVYNDSGADFNINTIKGQFNFCIVMIEPLDHGINRVTVKTKEGRIDSKFVLGVSECKVISDQNVALLARQLALHCTLASLISRSLTDSKNVPYASNSLERLRIIKRLRSRLVQERATSQDAACAPPYTAEANKKLHMDDFTEYT